MQKSKSYNGNFAADSFLPLSWVAMLEPPPASSLETEPDRNTNDSLPVSWVALLEATS